MTTTVVAALSRAFRVRELMQREQRRAKPDALRLMRLNGLALKLRRRLDVLIAATMHPQPRLVPIRIGAR